MKKLITQFRYLRFAGFKTLLFLFLGAMSVVNVFGQTTVFVDDFNRAAVSPGGSPSMTYTTTNTGTGSAIIESSIASGTVPYFKISNGGTAGRSSVTGSLSAFSSSFNSTLSSNIGLVTWSFNARHNRNTTLSGFDAGNYGYAVVLVASSSDLSTANGYAVVSGGSSSNVYRLVKFTGGLYANSSVTNLITGVTQTDRRDYMGIKVTYDYSTGIWTYFDRTDGPTATPAWADPLTGTWTSRGTSTDAAHTSTAMSSFGYLWNYSTSAGTNAYVDNFRVQVNVPVTWTSGWPKADTQTASGFTVHANTNVSSTAYYVVLASGSTAPNSSQVKAGQDNTGSAALKTGSITCSAASTNYSTAVTGLSSTTTYDVYFVAQDAGGSNIQASPVMVSVTTTASASAPSIQDPTATTITNNSAILGGNITSDGGSAITERGTLWNTTTGVTITDNKLAEGATTTGIFTHSRTSLPAKSHIYFKAYATNAINTTLSSEGNFYTLADEPTAQVTGFTATAASSTSIDLSWTAAAGADGYVILQRQSASASSGVPVDASYYTVGSALGNGIVAAYISSGATTSQTITGLSAGTVYTFKIYSVNSDGTNAGTYNYYTTSPLTATATTMVPPAVTYTWNQTGTASYATAANWTPTRTTPEISDILQFNTGSSIIVTNVPTQTIGQLQISNNTPVELQSSAAVTLTISGETGVDLNVQSGSALNIAQATNAIVVTVGTGATGSISGTVAFSNAAHKLTAVDASGITFQTGSSFTAGLLFASNAFGTTGTANSVVFANGSKYYAYAGANPFALTAPASIVVWQAGSTYVLKNTGAPSLGNRTYANFELDEATGASFTSSSALTMDNLIVTSGSWSLGIKALHTINGSISIASGATLNLNPATTAGTINLKGNINIVSGGILNINPSSTTEDITFSGTSVQNISNSGTLNNATGSSYIIANSTGVNFASNVAIPTLTINSGGVLNVNAGKQLTVSTAFTNNGTLNLLSSNSGTATILPPASITGSGTTTVQQYLPDARNWYVTSPVTGAVAPAGYSYFQRDEVASSWTTRPFVADSIFLRGHGYIVLPVAAASTLQFSGTLNSGNINTTLTKSGSGFNLIGNPYPCHLGWTYDFANANAALIESSIWVRTNAGTANNSGQWSFATFNAAAVESVPSVANAGVIAPMQAFWVKAKAAGTLTLDNTLVRSHQASNPLKAPAAINTDRQRLRLQVDNGTTTDETLIYFAAAASNAYDAFDSPKFAEANSVTQIFTTVDTEKLVINGMNSMPLDTPISLGFVPGSATSFSIKANEISNLPTDVKVILKDNATLTETDLTDGFSTYHFSPETTSVDRFSVIFRSAGVATSINNSNKINAQVFVNAANYITIIAPEKSNYAIYNAVGQLIENGILNYKPHTINYKLNTGVYVVKVNNQSTRVIFK